MDRRDNLIASWKPHLTWYHSKGFKLFPVDRSKSRSQADLLPFASDDLRAWLDYVRELSDRYESFGFAAATGRSSGVLVLDIGNASCSADSVLHRLVGLVGDDAPATLTAESDDGRRHLYFRHDDALKIPNLARVAPDAAIRSDGGYVVVPGPPITGVPSIKFTTDDDPASAAWLKRLLERAPRQADWIHQAAEPSLTWVPTVATTDGGAKRGLDAISREAAEILCAQPAVFVYQDAFVEAVVTDGRLYLHPLSDAALTRELCRAAAWVAETKKGVIARIDGPSTRLVGIIQTEARHASTIDGARLVRQVAQAPFLLPSGEVFEGPGYDASTRTLVAPHAVELRLPTPADLADPAACAGACFRAVLSHFDEVPFATDDHRAAFVALLLTLISRPMLGDAPTPIFIINANISGAGKTRLAQSAVMVATGQIPPVTTLPFKEEEVAKRLLAESLSATDSIIFDNVRTKLGGAAIESAITSGEITGRILGATEMRRGSLRLTWIATGNNCEVTSDMVARAIEIYLDAPDAEPRETTFRVSEAEWWATYLPEHRSAILSHLMGILLAHRAAGSPSLPRAMGSFGGWASQIAAAVWFASGCNPVDTQGRLREVGDSETEQLRVLLDAWPSQYLMTAAELMRLVETGGFEGLPFAEDHLKPLRDALEPYASSGGRPRSLNSLSRCLANVVNRSVRLSDGRTARLAAAKDHSGTRKFSVEILSGVDQW